MGSLSSTISCPSPCVSSGTPAPTSPAQPASVFKSPLSTQRLQEEARQRDLDWDRRRVQQARVELLGERQRRREQSEQRRALDRSNLSLAAQQRLQ